MGWQCRVQRLQLMELRPCREVDPQVPASARSSNFQLYQYLWMVPVTAAGI